MSHSILTSSPHRVLGVMQVMVSGQVHMLSIEAAGGEGGSPSEGFMIDENGGACIRVPEGATPKEIDERVQHGLAVAIRHFSRASMN